jgi:hypothetical protein
MLAVLGFVLEQLTLMRVDSGLQINHDYVIY